MNQRKQDVTEAELALLQSLWDEGRPRSGSSSIACTIRRGRRFMRPCKSCSIVSRPKGASSAIGEGRCTFSGRRSIATS